MRAQEICKLVKRNRGYDFDLDDIRAVVKTWLANKWPVFQKFFGRSPTKDVPVRMVATDSEINVWARIFSERYGINILEFGKEALLANKTPQGEKLGKFFAKRLPDSLRPPFLDDWDSFRKRIIADGFIRITVHPIEMLCVSDSTTGWTSCHSIHQRDRVCYWESNLLYATDKHTILTYFWGKREGFAMLPIKRWRQLWYWQDEHKVLISSRQYPDDRPLIAERVREIMLRMFFEDREPILINPDVEIYVPDGAPDVFTPYVDSNYFRAYSMEWRPETYLDFRTPILDRFVDRVEKAGKIECEVCGHYYNEEEMHTGPGGETLCYDCYNEHVVRCEQCGEDLWRDDATFDDLGYPYCDDCAEALEYCYECDGLYHRDYLRNVWVPDLGDFRLVCRSCVRDRLYITRCQCGTLISGSGRCQCGELVRSER